MRTPEARLKDQARALGFALVGIARAAEADGFARLAEWLARGYAGEMAYMDRHADARRHPAAVLPAVRSVVMVGMEYAVVSGQWSVVSENQDRGPSSRQFDEADSSSLTTDHWPLTTAKIA